MTQDKIVDRILKLKRHAESAESLGNEAEAQAFAEMFQRLMTEHKIEMTDLEFKALEETDPVTRCEVDYTKYPGYRERKVRIAWMERLASIIARAHFCRIIVHQGSSRVSICGRRQDAQVAEWMIVTLQRSAEKIADKETQRYRWEVYKRDGHCKAAQGFRGAFLQAFVMRLADRYEEMKRKQAGEHLSDSVALVRLRKEEKAVEDFMKKLKEDKVTTKANGLRRVADYHGEGARRGRDAADGINLDGKAVTSSATSRKELGNA